MKVTRSLKKLLRGSFTILYAVGILYWISRAWFRVSGEFGEPKPHLVERLTGPLHLLAATFFVFVLGLVWSQHIRVSLRVRQHRVSGWLFLILISVLILTGTVFVYFGQNTWTSLLELAHPILGAVLLPLLVLHWVRPGSRMPKPAARRRPG